MKILLAENDETLSEVMSNALHDLGHEVHVEKSVVGALDYLRTGTCPDLILVDWIMNGDAYELARKAKELGCKAILMTAVAHPKLIAERLGMLLVTKPFDLDDLIKAMYEAWVPTIEH
jgi:CheY-like chemotaxis protein